VLRFGVPADHPRRHAFDAARDNPKRARLRTGNQVALRRLVNTFDHERRLGLDLEEATHQGVGFLADAQTASGGSLLHAGCDVDGDTANGTLEVDAASEKHIARVNSHAHIETRMAETSLHFGAKHLAECELREATRYGALGVILSRLVGAEHSQDAVARVLQHLAAMFLHQRSQAVQRPVHHFADGLGIQMLAERSRADDVEKQDGDLLQRLHEIGRVRFRESSQLRAQRSYARVDDSVTQDTALRLDGGDRGFELLLLRGH